MVQPDRPQMIIRRMCITCWLSKAKNIYPICVILTAFSLQQWLHERASVLRYTYTASIVANYTLQVVLEISCSVSRYCVLMKKAHIIPRNIGQVSTNVITCVTCRCEFKNSKKMGTITLFTLTTDHALTLISRKAFYGLKLDFLQTMHVSVGAHVSTEMTPIFVAKQKKENLF
jgi:hypothetical protein